MIYQTAFRKEEEKEAESKSETEEESQCEAEEAGCEAQESIEEKGCEKKVSRLKTRKEVRMLYSESILVRCDVWYIFHIQLNIFCTYIFKGNSNFKIGDPVEIF